MLKSRYNDARIKLREYLNYVLCYWRRKKLQSDDFSIISNNCWAGHVYRYFRLPYATPTIGMYIWAEDFLTLLSDLKGFFEEDLFFILPEESKHYLLLKERQETNVPIGCLEHDGKRIEIVFLHYQNQEEAKEKWQRRVKRVNYDHLIIKNSFQNGCTYEMVKEFEQLSHKNKMMFVHQKQMQSDYCVYYKGWEHCNEIGNDINFFLRYINIYSLINCGVVKRRNISNK